MSVPAQDNTFTEGEWDYFYGEDVSMGDASLDFSKSTILFESKQGEITPVFQSNLMNNGSDKSIILGWHILFLRCTINKNRLKTTQTHYC